MPLSLFSASWRTVCVVRVSGQAMARVSARPVFLSHTTVVSRWLVMPAGRSGSVRGCPEEQRRYWSVVGLLDLRKHGAPAALPAATYR